MAAYGFWIPLLAIDPRYGMPSVSNSDQDPSLVGIRLIHICIEASLTASKDLAI